MKRMSLISSILIAALTTGTLDIIGAIVFLNRGDVIGTFKYIARGAFGDLAVSGGIEMTLLGIFFHYLITIAFTTGYFMVFPWIPYLGKYKISAGLLYGIMIWLIMHFMILPLSHDVPSDTQLETILKPIILLMVSIGLPTSLFAAHYYKQLQG